MKKVFVTSVAVVMMVLMLAACGGNKDANVAGTYKMTGIESAGVTMDMATIAETYGIDADLLNIELKEDGTLSMTALVGADTQTATGTWKADGNSVTLTIEGDDQAATIDGNKLTMEMSEGGQTVKMVFEK